MKTQMLKPTIRTLKNINGRKITGYEAMMGNISIIADTKDAAVAKCVAAALQALNNDGAVLVMHDLYPSKWQCTWILEFRNGSWGYRMARPMRPGSHCDGHSSCSLNVTDRRAAEIKMQEHWYQNNVEPFVGLLVAIGRLAG